MKKVALLLLVAPLALAACGGGSRSSHMTVDPVAYLKDAASKTASLKSEHMVMKMTAKAAGQSVTMNGSGDFSNANKSGTLDMSVAVGGRTISMREVLDGTTAYVSSPLFAAMLPSGKTWMKMDMKKIGASQGLNYSQLMSQSPSDTLKRLEAAGSVTSIGTETIDGTATTHYRVSNLDLSKIPQASKLLSAAHASVKYGPIDVWIGNADGYVRQITFSATGSAGSQSLLDMSATMTFTNFNETVDVTVPPANTVFDASNLVHGIGGG